MGNTGVLIYLIPPLITLFFSTTIIAVTVAKRGSKKTLDRFLITLMATIMLMAAGEMGIILAGRDFRAALYPHYLVMIAAGMFAWLYMYISFEYPTRIRFLGKYSATPFLVFMLLAGILFFINAMWNGQNIPPPDLNGADHYQISRISEAVGKEFYYPSIAFLGIQALTGMVIMLARWHSERDRTLKKQLMWVIIGYTVLFGFWPFNESILPALSVQSVGIVGLEVGITGLIVSYALLRYQVFIIDPAAEQMSMTAKRPLQKGYVYIVVEDEIKNPERSYGIFGEHVKSGIPGLVITSRNPAMLRRKYGLEKTPIIYMTDKTPAPDKSGSENVIFENPSRLFENVEPVTKFLSSGDERVFMVDCYDYLVYKSAKTVELRAKLLYSYINFLKIIHNSNVRMITPVDARWINVKPPGGIAPSNSPLGVDNLLSIILLEHMCNECVVSLKDEAGNIVSKAIERLRRENTIFTRFRYEGGAISFDYDFANRFTRHDTIRYLKMFIRELGPAGEVQVSGIRKKLSEFGIKPYEYDLEPGHGYIVRVRRVSKCAQIFAELVDSGYRGLYISRANPESFDGFPDEIKSRSRFLWLTSIGDSGNAVPPRLEHIQKEVEEYMEANRESRVVLVLDNLAYLAKHTGSFDDMHLFVAKLRDIMSDRNGIFLVPVLGDVFPAKELAVLKQELAEIDYTD
jgi:hypothetical protein